MSVWIEAARPRTLPAAVSPVLVGTAATSRFEPLPFALALVVSLSLQVAVNFANDLFDAASGVDTAARVGPRRAVAAGIVSPARMKRAIGIAFAVAAIAGLGLALRVGVELLLVGVACFVAALGYSGGPKPYASAGLGEVFVFVFFGLVATIGSAYVQDEQLTALAAMSAIPVGLLASAILTMNNLRDIHTDEAAGKNTLSVRLGPHKSRRLYFVLLGVSYLLGIIITLLDSSPWPLLALGSAPLALRAARLARGEDALRLVAALGATAQTQLAFSSWRWVCGSPSRAFPGPDEREIPRGRGPERGSAEGPGRLGRVLSVPRVPDRGSCTLAPPRWRQRGSRRPAPRDRHPRQRHDPGRLGPRRSRPGDPLGMRDGEGEGRRG